MIADRLLDRLARLGYVPTVWSLLRIAGFAAVALAAVSLVLGRHPGELVSPWNKTGGTNRSHVVSLTLGDTRGYRPVAGPNSYKIAWVGGSEALGVTPRKPAIIPGLVNNKIRSVDGRRTHTDFYFQNAMRLADQLASLERALASKPDLVVISLNPVWVLNDLAVQQWSYLDGLLAQGSLWPPSSWPVAASLVGPGDLGWRALSGAVGVVDDRLHWGTQLTEKTSGLSFLHPVEGASEPEPTGLGELAQRRPVDFWHEHYSGMSPGASLRERQLSILGRGVSSESSLNDHIVREMFAAVRRAGVEAYFYVPAIAPEVYADPTARRYIEELRDKLAEVTEGQTTKRVRFDPRGLQDRVPPTKYKDMIHKLQPGAEVDVLTGDLCDLLQDTGHETGCEKR